MNNKSYDNVDDKKELYNIIENYMDEECRKQFLEWACKHVNTSMKHILRPGKNSTYHPKEVYWQVMCLAFMHSLDLKLAAQKMVEIAKHGRMPTE